MKRYQIETLQVATGEWTRSFRKGHDHQATSRVNAKALAQTLMTTCSASKRVVDTVTGEVLCTVYTAEETERRALAAATRTESPVSLRCAKNTASRSTYPTVRASPSQTTKGTHMNWNWLSSAVDVPDDEESLEAASGDAPYILDGDDFGSEVAWVVAEVPLVSIVIPGCKESESEREERLAAIRSVPPNELYRPILELHKDRTIGLIDGGHRIEVAKERGQATISSLIKCCSATLAELRKSTTQKQPRPRFRP